MNKRRKSLQLTGWGIIASSTFVATQVLGAIVSMTDPVLTVTNPVVADEPDYAIHAADITDCSIALAYPPPNNPDDLPAGTLEQTLLGEGTVCEPDTPPGGPGGNVELGNLRIDDLPPPNWPTYSEVIHLDGRLNNANIRLSSLIFSDWTTPIGNITLAKKLVLDAIVAHCDVNPGDPGFPNDTEIDQLTALFLAGSAQKFSDPNISYVHGDSATNQVWVGLAGHLDASGQINFPISCPLGVPPPEEIQLSEVVHVQYQSLDTYLYSFDGQPSGLTNLNDQTSFDANFPVHTPFDPPTATKTGQFEGLDIIRWRMEWVNPNSQSVLVRVVDPIPSNAEFIPGFDSDVDCTGVYDLPPSIVPICEFVPGDPNDTEDMGSVVFEGLIGPNMTATISFTTGSDAPVVVNEAAGCWDANGDGTVAQDVTDCDGRFPPVTVAWGMSDLPPPRPPFNVPAIGLAGLAFLAISLPLIGAYRRRRKHDRRLR